MTKLIKSKTSQSFVYEECNDLAREGLRTLVFSYKILEEE